MFWEMRRIKQELSIEETKELLRTNKRAVISVNGDDGYPYAVPINFYYDEAENRIYFHGAKTGHKIESIKKNKKVCFTAWDDGYKNDGDWAYYVSCCVVFGHAVLIDDPELTEEKMRIFANKYYPTKEEAEMDLKKNIDRAQLIAIDIVHITGKKVHEK